MRNETSSIFNENYQRLRVVFAVVCVVLLSISLVSQANVAADDSNANTAERIRAFVRRYPGLLRNLPDTEFTLHVDDQVYAMKVVDGRFSIHEGASAKQRFEVYTDADTLDYLLSSRNLFQFWQRLKSSLKAGKITVRPAPALSSRRGQAAWTGGNIVTGRVKQIECRWEEDLIYSYVTIFVVDVERGPEDLEGEEIIVKHIGGGIDDVILWQSSQPYFMVGEMVRVHLQINTELEVFTVIGGPEGKVSLDNELQPIEARTAAGYKLFWYKPGVGWEVATDRPGAGWYGPLKWEAADIPVKWYIDQTTSYPGISWSTFRDYVKKCYQTWEDEPTSTIDYTYMGYASDKTWGSDDGFNIFCWRSIDGPGGILGECMFRGQLVEPNAFKMLDADIRLDTGDSWSAAETCSPGKFDVQNVGTHECGHSLGLADLYDAEDSEMTMYGHSSQCETKKRDLASGDIAGVYALYPGCLIATAAYGSELSPEVQFLRGFRNQIAMDTFVGAEGVAVFNQIYFSFSPNVAQFIAAHPTIRLTVKNLLYPLVGIVHLSAASYSLFTFHPELGVTVATLLGGSLIGAIYCAPWAMLIIVLVKRYKKKTLKMASLKPFVAPWLIGAALIGLAGITMSGLLMKIAASMLVLTTTAISATGTALALNMGIRLLHYAFRFATRVHKPRE